MANALVGNGDGDVLAVKAAKSKPSPAPKTKTGPKASLKHAASIFGSPKELPQEFVDAVRELESQLGGKQVWMVMQPPDGRKPWSAIDDNLIEAFIACKSELPSKGVALLVNSLGGLADPAYRLSMLLRRRCGSFTAIVPRYAKSAATLLCLGATEIILGEDAELGPLDAQILDHDREEGWVSALDEVQAVQELQQSAMQAAYGSLVFMKSNTKKRLNALMPDVFKFASELNRPLFERIDTIRFSRMSRLLDVAEQYAVRLLQPRYTESQAKTIAGELVERYPSHEYPIDHEEARRVGRRGSQSEPIGLQVPKARDQKMLATLDRLYQLYVTRQLMERFQTAGNSRSSAKRVAIYGWRPIDRSSAGWRTESQRS